MIDGIDNTAGMGRDPLNGRPGIDALNLIRAERETQIVNGYTAAFDDAYHENGSLASAAAYIAQLPEFVGEVCRCPPDSFCAKRLRDKCKGDRLRELTVAGALIVAEIERLQRLQ